jgi:hypothetical protein
MIMGQRLNIEIRTNEKQLANCYYHWSGYTATSLGLTTKIIDAFVSDDSIKPTVDGAIALLRLTGAEFNQSAWDAAYQAGFVCSPNAPECKGRNAGLIAVTKKEMDETRKWEEGRIEINLESNTFRFDCAYKMDAVSDDVEIWERTKDLFTHIDLPTYRWNLPFYCMDALISGVERAEKNTEGRFAIKDCALCSIY